MESRLVELQNHLFDQIERLGKVDLKGDALKEEITRSDAMTRAAQTVIQNGKLFLDAMRTVNEFGDKIEMTPLLGEYKPPKKPTQSEKATKERRQLISRHALGE